MKLTRYEKYKNSGIEWIGEVPEHWDIKRVKDVFQVNKKTINEATSAEYEFSYIDIGNVDINGLINTPEIIKFKEAPSRARRIVRKNDIIISTVRTYLKAVAFFDTDLENTIVSTGFAVLTPNKNMNPKFFRYSIMSEFFINEVNMNSLGVSYPAINSSTLAGLILLFSFNEQTTIANFLDKKTAAIDQKIELLQQKSSAYEELKKTLINETVCRGLDTSVELKDSGIEWIGKIPKHWEVKRVKDIFRLVADPAPSNHKLELLSIYTEIGVRPRKSLEQRGNKAVNTDGYWIVKRNDFIVNKLLAWMGAIGLSHYDGVTSPAYDVLRKVVPLSERYYEYLFRSKISQIEFKRRSRGIMEVRLRLYFDKFGQMSAPFPNHNEQAAIADYLDEKCKRIDIINLTIKKEIELLKELRKTLINDVVTGKVKVPHE